MDPDEFLQAHGPDAFRRVLDSALPVSEFQWRRWMTQIDVSTPEGRARLEHAIHQWCDEIRDMTVRRHFKEEYLARLARLSPSARQSHRERRNNNVVSLGLANSRLARANPNSEPGLGPVLRGAKSLVPQPPESEVVILHPLRREPRE